MKNELRLNGFSAEERHEEMDVDEYEKVFHEMRLFVEKALMYAEVDRGLLVLSSGKNGWLSVIHKRPENGFCRTIDLEPRIARLASKLSRHGNGKVSVKTVNVLLNIIGEEKCKEALGWSSELHTGYVLTLVLMNKGGDSPILKPQNLLLVNVFEYCVNFIQKTIREKKLLAHTLNCLLEVNKTILENNSFEAVLERVIEGVKVIVGAKGAGLLLYDEDTKCLKLQKPAFGSYDDRLISLYKVKAEDGGNAIRVFQSKEPYLSNNVQEDPRFIQSLVKLFPAKCVVSVPVVIDDRCIGVFHVIDKPGGFNEDDVMILKLIVSQLAVALENARFVWRIKMEEAQSRNLYELSREFKLPDVESLIKLAAEKILNVLSASLVAIALRDNSGRGMIVTEAGIKVNWVGRSVSLSSVELEIKDLTDIKEPLEKLETEAVDLGMQTQVELAIGRGSSPLGKIWVWSDRKESFSPSQTRFLSLVASQLASALENADLFEREKSMARRLQRFIEINEQLVWLILKGVGIQAITENLAHHLKAGVVFYDHRLTRRAWARVTDGELVEIDAFINRVMKEEGTESALLKYSPQLCYEQVLDRKALVALVQVEGDVLGYLCALREDAEQNSDFKSIVQQTLSVYALELLKERVAQEVMQSVERDFVGALLGGRYSEEEILERATSIGYDLNSPYVVAVAEYALEESLYSSIPFSLWQPIFREVKYFLKHRYPQSIVAKFQEQLIMLIPYRPDQKVEELENLKNFLRDLKKQLVRLNDNTIYIGIGRVAQGIRDLESSYKDACFTIRYMKQTKQEEEVLAFKDLGLYQVLASDNATGQLFDFTRELLGPLLKMDRKRSAAYLKTLDCYFASGCNIKATSESLFCHLNTVRYRLERIKKLLKIDLNDVEDRFSLQMALKLAKFYYPELF